MFGYIYTKVNWTINLNVATKKSLNVKINSKIKNEKSQLQVESIILKRNKTCQNQICTSIINFARSKSGTKLTLHKREIPDMISS